MNIDSSNMQPEGWLRMARAVHERLGDYDGFVVTHGTDTMAYSAAALSFMLGRLDRPVVLTGSQLTLEDEMTDAPANLRDAIAAARSSLSGVFIAFGGLLLSGVRASKMRSRGLRAFESINADPIGVFRDGSLEILRRPPVHMGSYAPFCDRRTALVKIWPGFDPRLISDLSADGYRGVILEAFGLGGIPSLGPGDLGPTIRKLVEEGVLVVITTQCVLDGCHLDVYEVGRRAMDAEAISAGDMTKEAALTKLMWALGQSHQPGDCADIFTTRIWDEMAEEPRTAGVLVRDQS